MAAADVYFAHRLLRARDWQDRPELDQLCQWWRDGGHGVCALVGIGGAGKTAIVDRFLRVLPNLLPDHPDLEKDARLSVANTLFVFSFYNSPNPDLFFDRLYSWLSHQDCGKSVASTSYERTFQALAASGNVLLVLDGLEKVQNDGLRGGYIGRIQHGALRDLVLRVADGLLPNVSMILTTRFVLDDLEYYQSRMSLP